MIRRSLPRRFALLASALLATAAPLGAFADPVEDARARADAHLEEGRRLYDTQSYPEAIAHFKEGYRLDPRPPFLYALAQAQRMSGDCQSAIVAYRAFLRSVPAPAARAAAEANIARCEATLGDSQAEPSHAEKPGPSARPTVPPSPMAKGSPPAAAATPAPVGYADRLGGIVTLSGLAVALGGGGLLIGSAVFAGRESGAKTYDDYASAHGTALDLRAAGIVGVAIGGALVGLGVASMATRRPSTSPGLSVSVTPSRSGVLLSVGGSL